MIWEYIEPWVTPIVNATIQYYVTMNPLYIFLLGASGEIIWFIIQLNPGVDIALYLYDPAMVRTDTMLFRYYLISLGVLIALYDQQILQESFNLIHTAIVNKYCIAEGITELVTTQAIIVEEPLVSSQQISELENTIVNSGGNFFCGNLEKQNQILIKIQQLPENKIKITVLSMQEFFANK
jgi:hypothetical protein